MSLAPAPTNPYPAIVCFGDSQTQYAYRKPAGFVAQLSDAYQRRADVVNRGFSGYTTRDAVHVLKYVFNSDPSQAGQSILAATVWLGCNDSIDEGNKQYVSPEDYATNLSQIITSIQSGHHPSSPAAPYILVLGPTPVITSAAPSHHNERKELYTNIARKVVSDHQSSSSGVVELLDTYALFNEAAKQEKEGMQALLDADGLHIAPKGYEVLSQAIMAKLKAQPGLKPEDLPMIFPHWETLSSDAEEVGRQLVPATTRGRGVGK